MGWSNIRILPLLVVVAMLSFSVRLAEVVYGVTHWPGAAEAADAPAQTSLKDAPKDAPKADAAPTATPPADTAAKPDAAKTEAAPAAAPAADTAKAGGAKTDAKPLTDADKPPEGKQWYDAGNSDTQFSNVRTELYDNLAKRRADLDKREADLVAREALIRAGQQELDRKYNELSQLRGEIEKLLKQQSDEEQARIASLVKIYEGMKPADAARIFDTLDLDVLMSVMSHMSERKLSPIMGLMNPERAKTITTMMAEQKQLPQLPPAN